MLPHEALYSRTAGLPAGKAKTIRDTLAQGLQLQEARANAAKHDDLTPKGRAALIEKHIKNATGPALARTRRQFAYHERALEKQRGAVRAKAIGESKPTDAEWRTYLRSLPLAERAQAVLKNPEARGPALREPALAGLNDEIISNALEIATREKAPKEAAALTFAEEAQELHDAAIRMLMHDLMETPFIVSPNGVVRKLNSPAELDKFLEKEIPTPAPVVAAIEEKEVDVIEEAA